MRRLALCWTAVALFSPSPGWAETTLSSDSLCYYPDTQWSQQVTRGMSSRSIVEARMVFVYFPPPTIEQTDSLLPVWADSAKGEVKSFNKVMSRNQQTLKLKIVKRLGADSIYAWRAKFAYAHYESTTAGWGDLNQEIMLKIHNTYRNAGVDTLYWNPVHAAFILPYEKTFRLNWGGVAQLSPSGTGVNVPGFQEQPYGDDKRGVTQRLFSWDNFTVDFNDRVPAVLSHEYGHILFDRNHSPRSGNPPSGPSPACGQYYEAYVNMGKYDMMRGIGGPDKAWETYGLAPYHPRWLMRPDVWDASTSWVRADTITSDIRGLHVPQIRGTSARLYWINTSIAGQAFLFGNFQGATSSRFDNKLGGTGLLVWHLLGSDAWDLESAKGKKPGVGVAGKDSLEANWCYLGDPKDFFNNTTGAGGQDFSITTNPSTNLWPSGTYIYYNPQTVRTSIALENIRQDTQSSDVIVDVFLTPKQYVTYPNDGEVVSISDSLTITWDDRPYANIYKVDLALSTNGGASLTTLATNQPNSGSFTFAPTTLSEQCRVRVTSYDSLGSAADTSDANFTVWGIIQDGSSPVSSNLQLLPGLKLRATITWNTSISTSSGDSVTFYDQPTGGTAYPGTPIGALTYGTSHSGTWEVAIGGTGDWWYEVSSTAANGTRHRSGRRNVYVDPRQLVIAPNGGETLPVDAATTVTWLEREQTGITSVDIALSTNGASAYTTIATAQPNTGSYQFTPTVPSNECRMRVTSHDSLTSGADVSDATFTVHIVQQASVSHSNLHVPVDSILVDVNWSTIDSTQSSGDQVRFYRSQTGGSPIAPSSVTYSTSQGGLSHTASCVTTPCDPGYWWYEVKSTHNGGSAWSARTSTTKFKVNACVTP